MLDYTSKLSKAARDIMQETASGESRLDFGSLALKVATTTLVP